MNKIRQFRFFLSWLIFEIILKWEAADQLAKQIINDVSNYNERHQDRRCHNCRCQKLITKIIGGEGLFSCSQVVYKCTNCGNEQYSDGSDYLHESDQLNNQRIIKDGDDYRYRIITDLIMIIIAILVVIVSAGCPIILLYRYHFG